MTNNNYEHQLSTTTTTTTTTLSLIWFMVNLCLPDTCDDPPIDWPTDQPTKQATICKHVGQPTTWLVGWPSLQLTDQPNDWTAQPTDRLTNLPNKDQPINLLAGMLTDQLTHLLVDVLAVQLTSLQTNPMAGRLTNQPTLRPVKGAIALGKKL